MKKIKKLTQLPKTAFLLLFALLLAAAFTAPCTAQAASKLKLTAGCKYTMNSDDTTGLQWTSSNPSVVKVTGENTVKALKAGKAKLIGTVEGAESVVYTVKVIKFKPVKMTKLKCYGKYRKYMSTSEFKKAYKIACKLVKPYAGYSKKDKLYAIASELRNIFDKYGSYSMKAKHYNDPYGYLVKHTASCAGCVRATGLCLNILGISFEHVNENQYSHQWCRVKVGKQYWICDAFGLYVGKEPGKRKHPYLS